MNQILYTPVMFNIAQAVNKPVRLVQCIAAHNEEEFIGSTLRSIYDQVDKIIVIEGAVESRKNVSTPDGHSIDRTIDIIEDFKKNHDPQKKVLFVKINRFWKNLEEQKNVFLDLMSPGEWVIINDADEIYRPEDIVRLRQAIDLEPNASEFIPVFLHFYADFFHVAKPGPEWNILHQRVFKYVRGMKYVSHPTVYDVVGRDTYFSQEYWNRRFYLNDFIVYHYGYARSNMDQIMKDKQDYYTKELASHGAANKKFDKKVEDWFANKEPILRFDGTHPDIMKVGDRSEKKMNVIGDWKDDIFYSKMIKNEEFGTMWLNQTKQSRPLIPFFHNEIKV